MDEVGTVTTASHGTAGATIFPRCQGAKERDELKIPMEDIMKTIQKAIGDPAVRDALKPYPNLKAILVGCVSRQIAEWPMIRTELAKLVTTMLVTTMREGNALQERDQLREHIAQLNTQLAHWREAAKSVGEVDEDG